VRVKKEKGGIEQILDAEIAGSKKKQANAETRHRKTTKGDKEEKENWFRDQKASHLIGDRKGLKIRSEEWAEVSALVQGTSRGIEMSQKGGKEKCAHRCPGTKPIELASDA